MTATTKDKFFALGVLLVMVGIAATLIVAPKAIMPLFIIFFGLAIVFWARGHLHQYGLTMDPEAKIIPVEGAFCTYCGKEHGSKSGAQFCPFCGKDL